MVTITFYPLGNADTFRFDLADGRKMLFDLADRRNSNDQLDRRCDVLQMLRDDLTACKRDYFDVVAFTHGDDDHICGASDFFHLEHAGKYQGSDRIKISELWVPSAMLTETNLEGNAAALRAEARYRLKKGTGIRVFSRPGLLKNWLENQGVSLQTCLDRGLIVDAGEFVPGFVEGPVSFFVHSPFAVRSEDGLEDRNGCCLIFQVTVSEGGRDTRILLGADGYDEVWNDIVRVTRTKGNAERLQWDVAKIPHHCSGFALGPDCGPPNSETKPGPNIEWLWSQGAERAILISTSDPIPAQPLPQNQPPHPQAARFYRRRASELGGLFKVTMEHPTALHPEPLVITIDACGPSVKTPQSSGVPYITNRPAPRAGL